MHLAPLSSHASLRSRFVFAGDCPQKDAPGAEIVPKICLSPVPLEGPRSWGISKNKRICEGIDESKFCFKHSLKTPATGSLAD